MHNFTCTTAYYTVLLQFKPKISTYSYDFSRKTCKMLGDQVGNNDFRNLVRLMLGPKFLVQNSKSKNSLQKYNKFSLNLSHIDSKSGFKLLTCQLSYHEIPKLSLLMHTNLHICISETTRGSELNQLLLLLRISHAIDSVQFSLWIGIRKKEERMLMNLLKAKRGFGQGFSNWLKLFNMVQQGLGALITNYCAYPTNRNKSVDYQN